MNYFSTGMPLVGGSGNGLGRRAGRTTPYMRAQMPKCEAKVLKTKASLIDASGSEGFEPCRATQIKGDCLCSIHRRQVQLSAEKEGVRIGGGSAVISVPYKAYKTAKFRLGYLHHISNVRGEKIKIADDTQIEIWNPVKVEEAALSLYHKD